MARTSPKQSTPKRTTPTKQATKPAGATPRGKAGSHTAAHSTPVASAKPSRGGTWDYAPAPETVKVAIADRYDLFINGDFIPPRDSDADRYFDTINPATEATLSRVAQGSAEDVDRRGAGGP